MEFYLGFYEMLEDEILRVVNESMSSCKVLGAFNTTSVALIPKHVDVANFENYRPISLCNLIYKVVSKVIENRIKGILSSYIFE